MKERKIHVYVLGEWITSEFKDNWLWTQGGEGCQVQSQGIAFGQDIFWLSGIETDKTDFVVWQMIGAITHSAFCPSRFSQTLSDSSPAYKDAN